MVAGTALEYGIANEVLSAISHGDTADRARDGVLPSATLDVVAGHRSASSRLWRNDSRVRTAAITAVTGPVHQHLAGIDRCAIGGGNA